MTLLPRVWVKGHRISLPFAANAVCKLLAYPVLPTVIAGTALGPLGETCNIHKSFFKELYLYSEKLLLLGTFSKCNTSISRLAFQIPC